MLLQRVLNRLMISLIDQITLGIDDQPRRPSTLVILFFRGPLLPLSLSLAPAPAPALVTLLEKALKERIDARQTQSRVSDLDDQWSFARLALCLPKQGWQ